MHTIKIILFNNSCDNRGIPDFAQNVSRLGTPIAIYKGGGVNATVTRNYQSREQKESPD